MNHSKYWWNESYKTVIPSIDEMNHTELLFEVLMKWILLLDLNRFYKCMMMNDTVFSQEVRMEKIVFF